MNNRDRKTITATSAGHEGHGAHTCHKCGWPFSNPHPSAKNRRAHKKICGTIEGYKVLQLVIDDDTHFAITVNEHTSDENGHSPDTIELLSDTTSLRDAIAQINANSPSEHVVHLTNNAAQTVNASTLVGLREFAQPHLIKDDNALGPDTVKSRDEISEPALMSVDGKEKPCDHFELDVSPRTDDSDKTVNSADEQVYISASDLTGSIETPGEKVLAEEAHEYFKASVSSTSLNNSDAESTFETNNVAIESLNSDGLVYMSEHDSDIVASDGTLEHPPPSLKEAMPISSESIDDAAEVSNEIRNGHVDNFSKENVNLDLASSTMQEALPENQTCSNEAFTDVKGHQGAVSTSLQGQEPSPLNLEDSQETCLTGHDKITENGEENLDMIVSGTKPPSPKATSTSNISNKEIKAKDIETQPIKSEVFETPSFIESLTQPSGEVNLETGSPEIETLTGNHQSRSNYLQASVFPSLTNVVSDSDNKINEEEIIAKVTNSNPETQHSSLKTLLDEDKTPNTKQDQKEEDEPKDDAACSATVKSVLIEETLKDQESNKDIKEGDSPARYTIVDKKQKKKKMMKSYWVPFMCCSSVHGDS